MPKSLAETIWDTLHGTNDRDAFIQTATELLNAAILHAAKDGYTNGQHSMRNRIARAYPDARHTNIMEYKL